MFDKLTSMQVFVSVAYVGSFARAAEQHQISSAMVTKHVQRLEDHLNSNSYNAVRDFWSSLKMV
ncbi:LysR family transcriptional regulator [Acinetobacter sp. ANC 5414]|uniref:helix-turn-helix domain-containing protein n=1 Tax=Acinetobacter sp. ANC 5414 TaxID=2731251 RepID=UPI00148FC2A9|nr:LysR family transcriptional regulator [Acinetobacter sp. ANC 5414]NNH01813.1 LysR family transcriptional regulator [Acinetobacter sp. ANC 5414]